MQLFSMRRPALAGAPMGAFDLCDLIPTQYVPGVRQVVEKIGCSPTARPALEASLLQLFQDEAGKTAWWQTFVASAGPQLLADCVCKKIKPRYVPPPPPPPAPWYGNPWLVAGALAAAGTATYLIVKSQAAPPPAPQP